MSSDIQVFVRLKEQSVFAGEEIQSVITFKNVASISDKTTWDTKTWHSRGRAASGNATELSQGIGGLSSQAPRLAAIQSHGARKRSKSGHRNTASLSIPYIGSSAPTSTSWNAPPVIPVRSPHNHQRSVSIISLGSPDLGSEDVQRAIFPTRSRPAISHGRSASLQVHPRRIDGSYDGHSSSSEAPALEGANFQGAQKVETMNHTDSESAEPAEAASNLRSESRRHTLFPQAFRFPNVHGRPAAVWSGDHSNTNANPRAIEEVQHAERDATLESPNSLSLASKVLTGTSVTGSNRSSGDFHSPNNRSQETLVSEQASIVPDRHRYPSPLIRQHYRMASTSKPKRTSETLLMGYAQVNATFTLDGALVDQTPFEEVKRKGFLGGQGGGGVVGVATPSNPGGLLGGFSLNSIGESIGGFLGGGESSSLKEMKGVTSSRAIPLLSTPQSLLFVDLTLVPGEEKSFSFRYTLPKGLPASYKGKSIKIVYNLNIGIQGAPGEKAVHAVRRVNIPFKVFSGVNDDGEIFGHDLMQPYVILQDNAEIDTVESVYTFPELASNIPGKNAEAATQDFLTYVDTLLNKRRRRQSSSATLEPPRGLIQNDGSSRAKQAIDRAIFLSKQHLSSTQSPNRFEIARNGKRIATIVLDRTLYRLGETVTAAVDLSSPKMPCYSLRSTLETTEKVNPALALRSAASITRLSRKVYRSHSENTLFAERLVFNPSIPVTATPTMMTSGVNLDWALRFEFVTTRVADSSGDKEQPVEKSLLESIVKDDRGSILAAVETLQCETFEISIPITVYGDTIVTGTEGEETSGIPV